MMDAPDGDRILELLPDPVRAQCQRIDVFSEIESTNSYLLDQPGPRAGLLHVAIADQQTAGRGRLANRWASPKGAGLYLSIACTFEKLPENLPAMSLAVGVAVADALAALGVADVRLKWPNDVILNDGKLGGILLEIGKRSGAATTIVIGIGINIQTRAAIEDQTASIGRVADLAEATDTPPSRNQLAATIIAQVSEAVALYSRDGLGPFVGRWSDRDWLKDKAVAVETDESSVSGFVKGLAEDGALLLEGAGKIRRVVSGSVRLQPASETGNG